MKESEQDPEIVRHRNEKEERRQRRKEFYAEMDRPLLDTLRSLGFEATSIEDVIQKHAPLPSLVVEILLKSLETYQDWVVPEAVIRQNQLDMVVRALAAAAEPFDGRPLVKCYETKGNEAIEWSILNTIACAKPHSIDGWIRKQEKIPGIKKTLTDLGYYR